MAGYGVGLNPEKKKKKKCVASLGQEDPLEKGMATHSSILVWRKSHGQRGLVGYRPWDHKELDMTE